MTSDFELVYSLEIKVLDLEKKVLELEESIAGLTQQLHSVENEATLNVPDEITEKIREGENPVRVPGRGSRTGARVSFGATVVAEVPSWKEDNRRMNFQSETQGQSPSRGTVWIKLPGKGGGYSSQDQDGAGTRRANHQSSSAVRR